ncbi:hypothetical protein HW130_02875 [Streptomyces sp. PKU-EA00015]|uniref:hypothetical protein n=1 Tax=Streptomyces sp. PKU-EA00015 TaxID=2748326 RepID=UPI0015A27AFB|nr:hypothetical protein [Streptomyces sp. PKU-EA00015]NWF25214.1 hypothetical protein [Streptomyces sp. PKU-EA00015]
MPDPDLQRYHLVLTVDGRPVMRGWWADRATADRKFLSWIGERGSRSGVRVTLTDQIDGKELAAWPQQPGTVSGT